MLFGVTLIRFAGQEVRRPLPDGSRRFRGDRFHESGVRAMTMRAPQAAGNQVCEDVFHMARVLLAATVSPKTSRRPLAFPPVATITIASITCPPLSRTFIVLIPAATDV